jgi:hypothetical protein
MRLHLADSAKADGWIGRVLALKSDEGIKEPAFKLPTPLIDGRVQRYRRGLRKPFDSSSSNHGFKFCSPTLYLANSSLVRLPIRLLKRRLSSDFPKPGKINICRFGTVKPCTGGMADLAPP